MKIKVAVIGCGSISQYVHAPEYSRNENVELVAFCDPQLNRAQAFVDKFGGKAFTDYKEVLKLKDLDAISVCTSNSTHASISIDAFKAGKHVLCEKPMAISIEEAKNMIEASKESGKFLMIGHNQRLVPAHIRAKQILESGELGRILTFKTSFGHGGPEGWSADNGVHTWFFKKGASYLGATGDLGIHKSDLIRWLIGEEIDEVCSMLSTREKKNEYGEFIDVEDNAMCILKSRSGIVGTISASWTCYGGNDNSTIIYLEKGKLRIYDHPEYPLIIQKKNGESIFFKIEDSPNGASKSNSGIIDRFISSIISGVKPEISGEEGFEALSIILASMESSDKKTFVKVKHVSEA